jgi:pSer/pThr/pTyr-binding forkhead associated (FHA) protein
VLPARQSSRRSAQTERDLPLDLVTISAQRELVLLVRGMVERLMLEENTPVTLGRTDMKSRTIPDVDLTPYGALDRGVSREHATLQIVGSRILVTDLGSTNGTFVAGLRLPPQTPTQLQKGDELMLGRLAIQVLFR